jgi:hypothetical protein
MKYGDSAKNNTWLQKQSTLLPSGDKKQILEEILQSDFSDQPRICNTQYGCWEDKTRHTNNDTETTRRFAYKKYPKLVLHMIQNFAPEDNQEEDTETHRQIRKMGHKAPDTQYDKEFRPQGMINVIESMGNKKTRGEDGIPNEV